MCEMRIVRLLTPLNLESETAGLVDLLQAGTTDFLVRRTALTQ